VCLGGEVPRKHTRTKFLAVGFRENVLGVEWAVGFRCSSGQIARRAGGDRGRNPGDARFFMTIRSGSVWFCKAEAMGFLSGGESVCPQIGREPRAHRSIWPASGFLLRRAQGRIKTFRT